MKLLDILASEMKDWPSTRTGAVGQSESGSLHLNQDARHGSDFFGWTTFKFKMAEDWKTAWVTRSEWQAAVDALNAPKVVEWDGVGLPPVGTVCQYQNSLGSWFMVEITAIAKKGICFIQPDRDGENYACKVSSKFRPIRTAEQVAAEERKSEILEMIDTFGTNTAIWGRDAVMEICGHLWESGYRKEPKPCGS